MNPGGRAAIATLALSAAALVGLVASEGYTDRAVIPTKGDVPTVGFGSTVRPDGSRVQMGETITPQRALAWTLVHIGKDEAQIKSCVTAPLYQGEYDVMIKFAYQYGANTLCNSPMVKLANAGDYVGSCQAYKQYRFITDNKNNGHGWVQYAQGRWKFDCSTPGNKTCRGVWTRQLKRFDACMAVQQ